MAVKFLETREVPVGDLKKHPENPNRGDVNTIAESLEQFGQYRSIVATKDLTILAGHHVVQAAKNIGLKTLRVDIISANAQDAKRIMLADNRIADLGPGPDIEVLVEVLRSIEDLTGTGYDPEYLENFEEDDEPQDDGPEPDVVRRRISLTVDYRLARAWDDHRAGYDNDTDALGAVLKWDEQTD